MKILLFTDTIGDLNGVSRFLQDMAELALSSGDDLQVVTSTYKNCPKTQNIHNFLPKFRVAMPFYQELDLAFAPKKRMEAFLLENKPDLIHISTPGPVGLIGRALAKKYKIPMLGTYHTDFPAYIRDNTGSHFLKRMTDKGMRYFYANFIHVFSRSHSYAHVMKREIGLDEEKISVIRAGTNLQRFSSLHSNKAIWSELGFRADSLKILYVGRISKEKNIPFLLDTWELFKKSYPSLNVELALIGEGNIKGRALELKNLDVHYLGPIVGERLSTLYASADIFVFPSVTDTLGQVVMEAAASRLPIIVSTIGGPKSLLNPDAQNGYALEIVSQKWVEVIRELVEEEQKRMAFGKSAEAYMQLFAIENSYEDFMNVHKKCFINLQQGA